MLAHGIQKISSLPDHQVGKAGKGESPKGREENGRGAFGGFPFYKPAALKSKLVPWTVLSLSQNKLRHSKNILSKPVYNPQQTKR